ncbi:MAG: RNB domain-containing ribonuclease [Deltaproteobacteria bacterium]|nr:RNB domain-containing ribonuclease [Deltaproteobacteria bacterium]MBW2018446.1 RNB domain-containing ribonuclease [Deltaproteobacteria bacterium]MBW2073733.1 RNB domain-containing ribonuclease [Deltaproteobacteria bacterium]RLB83606.1 MAG: exoribonuclease II [Deltaproteobacteria bacterium]
MEPGCIVEYIDRKQIVCAVVLSEKNQKLRMLTENNREVSQTEKRLAHISRERLDPSIGRDALVNHLQATVARRKQLQKQIDIEALWEVLHTEATWIDLQTMAEFSFDGEISGDHTSAVMRALFEDRLYFKFDTHRFFPNTPERVAQIAAQAAIEAKKAHTIEEGSRWVQQVLETRHPSCPPDKKEIIEILKSFYLFGKDSPHYDIGKEIVSRSGLDPKDGPFHLLVKLGIWDRDENLNLHRFGISETFPPEVMEAVTHFGGEGIKVKPDGKRRDLTGLSTITIDGQGTLDFDDAISIEPEADGFRLWVHITDVSHFLEKGSIVDEEAMTRGSSIYMPDKRIPMLPQPLAEDFCSLKEGQDRLAISIMARLDRWARVQAYEIFPSVIRVNRQLTYYDTNLIVQQDPQLSAIYDVAQKFRKFRLDANAIQLTLPEMNVWIDTQGEISVTQINRESPSRLMVAECMILANWLAARFFRDYGCATIFRSQLEPRGRLIDENGGTLYQNWMQRRLLSRVILGLDPEPHAGLGLDVYVTLTSPLRKYLDLVTQRQLRSLLGLEAMYSDEDLKFIIQAVEQPMSYITVLQKERLRYWILRYLERYIGDKEEALVLEKRRHRYVILLTKYMIECSLPLNCGADLKPQDTILVKIERVSARSDTIGVSLA